MTAAIENFAERMKALLSKLLPSLLASIGDHFPAQRDAMEAAISGAARWLLIGAASRTGKTFVGARIFMFKLIADYVLMEWGEEREYWCVAPTYDDCRAQKLELVKLIPRWLIDWAKQGKKGEFFDESHGRGVLFLRGGVTIILKSAERPERLVAFKLRGIWWTEIARSKIAAWPNVYARLSNYADSWFVADTSPLGHCWFYQDVWKRAVAGDFVGASVHKWKAIDSPYVPREVIEEARQNLPPAFFKREFEADWAAFVGQIHDVDEKIHVLPGCPFDPQWALIAADVNTTSTHPAEFLWLHCAGERAESRAHVAGCYQKVIGLDYELYANDMAIKYRELCTQFGEGKVRFVVDPSFHRDLKHKLEERGVQFHNGYNDVLDTIRHLGTALTNRPGKGPRLTFDEKARDVFEQIAGIKWKSGSDGVIRPEVDKTMDDGWHDCLRYAAKPAFPELYTGATQVK